MGIWIGAHMDMDPSDIQNVMRSLRKAPSANTTNRVAMEYLLAS